MSFLALILSSLILVASLAAPAPPVDDPRSAYDVQVYRLDLNVDPDSRRIEGRVWVELSVLKEGLGTIRLDCDQGLALEAVRLHPGPLPKEGAASGPVLPTRRVEAFLDCELPAPARAGQRLCLAITYSGSPGPIGRRHGVRWATRDGRPLLDLALQNVGAHHWFPCKASQYHPEDRPRRVLLDLTVPEGLVAAGIGRLEGRSSPRPGWVTWHWRHDYPVPTYGVGMVVGRLEEVRGHVSLPGLDEAVPVQCFVRAEHVPAASLEILQLEELLTVYSEAFGSYPFPESKVGIVEGVFLTVDHSTLLSYGSSWPAWLSQQGEVDPLRRMNRGYDFVLVHQLAHEWWGNAVGARSWRDYWLHEGIATFAEGLWLEHLEGRERADEFFLELARPLPPNARLVSAEESPPAGQVFSPTLHRKGAWVLHMVRHYLDDDEVFFASLRRFQERHRYGVAETADLLAVLEEQSGQDWQRFFDEWVYGTGTPRLEGELRITPDEIRVAVENQPATGSSFQVPLDLTWTEGGQERALRLWLEPGPYQFDIACASPPEGVAVVHLNRLLGRHSVRVVDER